MADGERLWATALACSALEGMNRSWLLDDERGKERTILDAGRAYIDSRCKTNAELASYVQSGELITCAERALRRWRDVHDGVVEEARRHEVLDAHWLFTHKQRAISAVLKSCVTDHETFATFLDAEGELQRWQAFMILMTLVASSLLTSIWFYSSRGIACCTEIRGLLDSGAGGVCASQASTSPPPRPINTSLLASSAYLFDGGLSSTCLPATPSGMCLGYTGNCGDLPAQFATLPGAFTYSPTVQCSSSPSDPSCLCRPSLQDYACHAFPDDAYVSDQVLVGLISVAVALPTRIVLEQAFLTTVEVDAEEGWMVYAGLPRLLTGWFAHRKWRWATGTRPSDLVVWLTSVYPGAMPWDYIAFIGWWVPKILLPGSVYAALEDRFGGRGWAAGWVGIALLACGPPGWFILLLAVISHRRSHAAGTGRREKGDPHISQEEEGPTRARVAASVGVLAVLAAWAVYTWFIFVYGMQIYTRLGPEAERKFAQTWGIGYGLDQAQQWKEVLRTAVKVTLVMVVLDLLRIKSNLAWLEEMADFASVQCMLFDGKARSWWQQTKELVSRQYRSFGG